MHFCYVDWAYFIVVSGVVDRVLQVTFSDELENSKMGVFRKDFLARSESLFFHL